MYNLYHTDPYLQRDKFRFSVDDISPVFEEVGVFNARIIPDVNSKYFPPQHLRDIRVSQKLLEKDFYYSFRDLLPERETNLDFELRGTVKQGGSYEVFTRNLPLNIFKGETIITPENDIFKESSVSSLFDEKSIRGELIIDLDGDEPLIKSRKKKLDALYLYCFNVGQGDSFLLIAPTGDTFLIDVNIYSGKRLGKYIEVVKNILNEHELPEDKVTGLIITHKHADHIRGSDALINSDAFAIDTFFINLSYQHSVITVKRLLMAARNKIRKWCNVNRRGILMTRPCFIKAVNPSQQTSTNSGAPDMNNSSIYLLIAYAGNCVHLTGDVSYPIINTSHVMNLNRIWGHSGGRLLKVSHHGSRTGTNDETRSVIAPTHAFISAGTSKKLRHPHRETLASLSGLGNRLKISKEDKVTVCYEVNKNGINQRLCENYSMSD